MEKIDLKRCHGLRFRAIINGDYEEGNIEVKGMDVSLCYGFKDPQQMLHFGWDCRLEVGGGTESELRAVGVEAFEIMPRDPDTYQDWQVGDEIIKDDTVHVVIFRCGEVVLYKYIETYGDRCCTCPYTCEELFRKGYRLVLTDIENQIIEEKKRREWKPKDGDICYAETETKSQKFIIIYNHDEWSLEKGVTFDDKDKWSLTKNINWSYSSIRPATEEEKQMLFDAMAKEGKRWNAEKKVVEDIPELRAEKSEIKSEIKSDAHQFKKFDPVLVRDSNTEEWKIRVFGRYRKDGDVFPYYIMGGIGYLKCIPLNEKTEHLLWTTEDYKEE